MNLGFIVQARMGSTRLPGKILKDFYQGSTILDIILSKLHKVPNTKVVVATSDNQNDDELVEYLQNKHEVVFRGPEDDVLKRFIGAAEANGIEGIIRICADNPFLDINGLCQLAQAARDYTQMDYIGFRVNGKPSILTHFGFWGEYVSLNALKRVDEITTERAAHEHVTNYVYTHDTLFDCAWISTPEYLEGRTDIRLTIDTIIDFENAQIIYGDLMNTRRGDDLQQIVNCLSQRKDIVDRMTMSISNNTK